MRDEARLLVASVCMMLAASVLWALEPYELRPGANVLVQSQMSDRAPVGLTIGDMQEFYRLAVEKKEDVGELKKLLSEKRLRTIHDGVRAVVIRYAKKGEGSRALANVTNWGHLVQVKLLDTDLKFGPDADFPNGFAGTVRFSGVKVWIDDMDLVGPLKKGGGR